MSMYVRMLVSMYVYMYACLYVCVCTYACMYMYVYVCMCACLVEGKEGGRGAPRRRLYRCPPPGIVLAPLLKTRFPSLRPTCPLRPASPP
jgi:hypothetical protein